MRADAILDQKKAPGLIENACRDTLVALAGEVPADQAIVELGSFKGRSTGHLAYGAQSGRKAHVWAVDPWETAVPMTEWYLRTARTVPEYRESATRQAFNAHMKRTGCAPFVTPIVSTALAAAEAWEGPPVALLFHDALQRFEDVRDDLTAWLPYMAEKATIVLHDVGDPRFDVDRGAAAVLADDDRWDWTGREIHIWPKQPDKRGFAVVRTRS